MDILHNLEKQFKTLVEEKFLSLFVLKKSEDLITRKLTETVLDMVQVNDSGELLAPNMFLIITSKSLELKEEKEFIDKLSNSLEIIGQEVGFNFPSKVIITTHTDQLLKEGEIQIIASFYQEKIEETHGLNMESSNSFENRGKGIPPYLILEGRQTISLDLPVTNIGRRLTNHIVLDDTRVSREHAQIREINGKYKIFDLNSKGGTYLNDAKITQALLKSGDVISCAGYPLIFIDDSSQGKEDHDKTNPVTSRKISKPYS